MERSFQGLIWESRTQLWKLKEALTSLHPQAQGALVAQHLQAQDLKPWIKVW